ncbi:hypothetical protein OI18_19855 [Flavihumibacter solisilvae]|uniref:Uncharacterized protein n=2 Tax=Flavihumibacter solisilvae TaxID=1349421 RepID=A0A0C1LBY2_9BACT|nr:hypothetical protein OI18_19855 [Flavihumibacter solisilvae]
MVASVFDAQAQSGTNSVYSAYGIGDVQLRDYNGYSAMGGLGVALPSVTTLNDLNPASYGSMPFSRMRLELSFGGKSVRYSSGTQNIAAGDFTVQKAAMGFSLFRNWGTAFGIRRYSNVEYLTSGNRYLQGTSAKLTSTIEGNGGLYEYYLANGLTIKKHLSLGVSIGLLSGSVNRKESFLTAVDEGITVDKNSHYSNAIVRTGAQYKFTTGGLRWIAGATWQPGVSLQKLEDNVIADLAGNTLVEENARSTQFEYPSTWSAGLTMQRSYWKFGMDYITQNWNKVNYQGANFRTTTSGNIAAGVSYSKPRKTLFGTIDGPSYSFGFNRDLSYLVIDGQQVRSWAFTGGVSLPSATGFYHYHFALKAGQRGTNFYPLVKENFFEFNCNISLASILYRGGRKYD